MTISDKYKIIDLDDDYNWEEGIFTFATHYKQSEAGNRVSALKL
jgi:hypothetical protein